MTENRETSSEIQAGAAKKWLFGAGFVIALLLGTVFGFVLRPAPSVVQVVVSPTANPNTMVQNSASEAPAANLMTLLLADARHFQGDPDAPITFIEFSDFK